MTSIVQLCDKGHILKLCMLKTSAAKGFTAVNDGRHFLNGENPRYCVVI